jgi:nucleoid-associated protein YgaU
MRRIRHLGAVIVLLALLVGVPWAMATTIGNPLNGWGALKAGDLSDNVVIDLLAGVVWVAIWVAWLQFTVAVVAAVKSAVTAARRPATPRWGAGPQVATAHVPGEFTGIPHLARWLVASALLIGTAAGVASTPARAMAAGPVQAPPAAVAPLHASPQASAPTTAGHNHASTPKPASPATSNTRTYVVPRDGSGPDTYWDIARTMLGSGERWHEIWDLNRGRTQADGSVMTQAGLLLPGWTVLVPADTTATGSGGDVVTVTPGDNLTEIADDHGSTEPPVWARNEGRIMSDGRVFTDPNLIKPGDTIIIPGPAHTAPSTPTHTVPGTPGRTTTPGTPPGRTTPHQPGAQSTPTPAPTQTEPAQPGTPSVTPSAHPSQADRPDHHQASPAAQSSQATPWGEVFAGFGAVLAAGLLGALVVRRRMSWRNARIGRTIASTPAHLIPAEKATLTYGSAGAPDGQFVDFALRSLAATTAGAEGAALPDVLAARMTGQELQLRLAEPHPDAPPAPWRVDESGLWWSVSVGASLPVSADNAGEFAAPYPTLVGVGYLGPDAAGDDPDDASAGGAEKWLVDLERAGAVALTGDRDRCLDLGRFIAAGLAVNDWSHHVTVTMVGFGDELVPINPSRLRYSEDLDAATELLAADYAHGCGAAENAQSSVLDARAHQIALDSFMPHVLLVAPHVAAEHDKLSALLSELADRPDRASVAIVLAGERDDVPAAGWVLHVTADGRLSLPGLGGELLAQRMPREQAADIAEMLHQAGAGREEPVPPAAGSRPWEQFIDAAGSLRPEFTLPRTAERPGPVLVSPASGPADVPGADHLAASQARIGEERTTTLLPAEDEAYLAAAATTAEDLEVVAPRVPAEVTERVAETVSGLDKALALWRDPDCPLPRLTLLGPVELRAHGQTPQRIPYYTEVAAYLASRDHGAQIEQVAEAFGVKNETAASRLKDLRAWLGVNPLTGEMHLPDARKSKASRDRGVSVYEIEDMLVDADLFQQLHLRGQTRGGEEGIADLEAALELVIGEPYSQQRTGGYAWLRDNPVDEYLKVAVEKVAHTVASWALERGELDRAEHAVRTALSAMPYAEVPRLDLAAVLEARGSKDAAERLLREEVCNRDDDGNGPLDLSERTEQIRRRREWLSAS